MKKEPQEISEDFKFLNMTYIFIDMFSLFEIFTNNNV